MKRRIVKPVYILLCVMLSLLAFSGCTGKDTPADYTVEEIKCMFTYGDRDGAEMDIYTPDGSVKQYKLVPYSDSGINIFAGDIPSDNDCSVTEYTISEDDWNSIVDAIKSNDFMSLPKELPKVEAYDGSTCYIEIRTSEGDHMSGGYCAGSGTGKDHQRFYNIESALRNMIKK